VAEKHLQELRAARTREGVANQTIKHEINFVRAAVIRAVGRGCDRERWAITKVPKKTRWLTRQE
jgi:hypothetical protein